jgi:long-chain fatty acid transport protein
MKRTLIFALVAAVPLAANATDGYFSHGYGIKAKGMGGASMAVAQDAFGGANNPASMAFVGNRFELGVDAFMPTRSADRTGGAAFGLDGSADSDSNQFFIPEFALNYMVSPNVALGVSVYGNGGLNTDYPGGQLPSPGACGPGTPPTGFNAAAGPYNLICGNGRLGVDLSQLVIAPTAAWQFAPGHSIGVAPLLAYQRFKAEGLQAFTGFSTSPGNMTNNGYDSSTGVGARVGYFGQITPQFSVGAAYSTKISMGEFDKYKGLFAEQGGFDIPSNWSIGVAFQPTSKWLIALDYERINYSDVASVHNDSSLLLACAAGSTANCLGGSNGAGFGWQSINVWKVGVQYAVNERWTVRAGYNHSDNPVRPQDVTINILAPGIVTDHATLGATWSWDEHNEISGAFMYAFNNSVQGPSLFNNFIPGGSMQEQVQLKEYSIGVQYAHKF